MKKILTLLSFLIFTISWSQTPEKVSYQTIIRDNANQLLANQSIGIQISILQGSASGISVYSETHNPTSNANGLVTFEIGNGTTSDDFSTVDWSNGPYFIKTEIDPLGGNSYTISGTTQLISVPYALHAKTAETIVGGITDNQNLSLTGNSLAIENGNSVDLSTYLDNTDAQSLDLVGNSLSISNGNTVILPTGADNWGTQTVVTNATLSGDGTAANPLQVIGDLTDNQNLSLTGNSLAIENGNSIDLSTYLDNTDAQSLDLVGNSLSISNGNTVILPTGADNWGTQTVVTNATLSGDGTAASPLQVVGDLTDNQNLSLTGNSLVIENGNSVDLSTYLDNTDAQNLSLTGNILSIDNGNSVDLSGLTSGGSTGWNLDGNTGTDETTNFIGNTDDAALVFKVNNEKSAYIGTSDDTKTTFGYQAGASLVPTKKNYNDTYFGYKSGYSYNSTSTTSSDNTGIGYQALYRNTSGTANLALGSESMYSNYSGMGNTALGYQTFYSHTYGNYNVAIGYKALYGNANNGGHDNVGIGKETLFNNSGYNNIGIGELALNQNTNGAYNIALGINSLTANTTGSQNIALGSYANEANTTGAGNVSIGFYSLSHNIDGNYNLALNVALRSLTTGDKNVALGFSALNALTSGDSNVAIGNQANESISTATNSIAIGYQAQAGSNQVKIGNNAITYAGIQVAWTTTSDRRWKENIQPSNLGLNFIKSLKPVFYTRKNDESKKTEYGFIAQELETSLDQFGATNNGIISKDKNGFYGVRYNDLIAPMVKAIQEQEATISQQQSEIELLKTQLQQQQELLNQLVKEVQNIKNN